MDPHGAEFSFEEHFIRATRPAASGIPRAEGLPREKVGPVEERRSNEHGEVGGESEVCVSECGEKG